MNRKITAVDIGASGGKMALAEYDGNSLKVLEYLDFPNRPADIGTALYWDVFGLMHSIQDGLSLFRRKYGEPDTVGIDTWGASYGLLDREGRLLEPAYHYRDARTADIMEKMAGVMSDRELFMLTGCQCNRTYTLPQLYACRLSGNGILDLADKMLFMPDLLGYFLTGSTSTEMTIAGTSCLLDKSQQRWSHEVAEAFDIPERMYTEIVDSGTVKGEFSRRVKEQTGCKHTRSDMTARRPWPPSRGSPEITCISAWEQRSVWEWSARDPWLLRKLSGAGLRIPEVLAGAIFFTATSTRAGT